MYLALFRAHLPVGVITDSQLEEGVPGGCRVLLVPAPGDLTDPMRHVIERFRADGGVVIQQRPEWAWHDSEGQQAAADALLTELGDEPNGAPVQVFGGPPDLHVDSYLAPGGDRLTAGDRQAGGDGLAAGGRLTVSLANEFTWVYTGRKPDAERLAALPGPPPACEGVVVEIRGRGTPERVFDAVTGLELPTEPITPPAAPGPGVAPAAGGVRVMVPAFDYMAVIVAQAPRL